MRIVDIIISLLMLVLLSPLFLLLAASVLLIDGAPVVFRQQRIGRLGKPFTMYKFRTMPANAQKNADYSFTAKWNGGVPDDFIFKSSGAARLTRTGVIMRRLSLDELPQLVNVLKGDMSLVGPRPEIPEIARHYSDEQRRRLATRPGITGLAQINGRAELTHGEKIRHDLDYVNRKSVALDFSILFATLSHVLHGRGAY